MCTHTRICTSKHTTHKHKRTQPFTPSRDTGAHTQPIKGSHCSLDQVQTPFHDGPHLPVLHQFFVTLNSAHSVVQQHGTVCMNCAILTLVLFHKAMPGMPPSPPS